MRRKENSSLNLTVSLPTNEESSLSKFLTKDGTFKEGNLLVNKDGVRILTPNQDEIPPPIKPSDEITMNFDDIEKVKEIGSGSSGHVLLVRHKWTGQFFALKVIKMTIDENIRKHIVEELKINQSSQCPNVVVYYQTFYDNGFISIVLEYMDGGSLADFLTKVKRIPEPHLAAISKQVLKGLMYLHHEQHIVHRDLKPSNLLINHSGQVKITDFGVSAILSCTSDQRDTFVGTYSYMSPERISAGTYGYKSDIWSLGILLLECATGEFPYTPQEEEGWISFYELLEAIVEHPPPCAPSDKFSPEFCSFISSCAQKDPTKRPSARELLHHPFINMHEDADVDLASYFTNDGSPLATFTIPN
ncbi:hypothetical protein MKX03_003845 [Papaver bracteatum]|nr:hypothetical protein MKX03_003845 [Papaver bracteatum]